VSKPEVEQKQIHRHGRSAPREFKCQYCTKVCSKERNLSSHMQTHTGGRGFTCVVCGSSFGRLSDHTRHMNTHMNTHMQNKKFICEGVLRNGATWGCGRGFRYADILKTHYKSEVGQRCRLPFLQEQEQEQEH
jgi:uncharacterized Zn-finger protein